MSASDATDPEVTAVQIARLEELEPPPLLEPREQPERHVEQHRHREQADDGLEHLAPERQDREDRVDREVGDDGGNDRESDAEEDGLAVLAAGFGRVEIRQEHREQQDGLESFAQQDRERLGEHDERSAEALGREVALAVVDEAAQRHDPIAHLVARRATLDQAAHARTCLPP